MNPILQRLINGFSKHGYSFTTSDEMDASYEFRKPDAALRFVVKLGEGGIFAATESTRELGHFLMLKQ
jgi:hypothetical protein